MKTDQHPLDNQQLEVKQMRQCNYTILNSQGQSLRYVSGRYVFCDSGQVVYFTLRCEAHSWLEKHLADYPGCKVTPNSQSSS